MLEHVIRHRDQRVLFAEHLSVLTNHGETVHVRVNHEGHIVAAFTHQGHDVAQVLLQRLRIMLEIAGRFAIEGLHGLYTQRSQQLGQDDATHRVDRIECHTEAGATYGIHLHQLQP